MNLSFYPGPPSWVLVFILGAHFAVGSVAGLIYFQGLRWTTNRFALGGHVMETIGLTLARFVLLGGLLTLASLEGAVPLLVTALGVFAARFAVMRRLRTAIP